MHHRQPILERVSEHTSVINLLLLGCLLMFGLLYMWQITKSASMGYHLADLEKRIEEVSLANQELENRVAENRGMYNVVRRVSILGMVRPASVDYLSQDGSMARR